MADPEHLDAVWYRFLPHKLSFVQPTEWSTCRGGPQALPNQPFPRLCQAEDGQLRVVVNTNDSLSPHRSLTAELTTADTPGDQDMFAALTTLEDPDIEPDVHSAANPVNGSDTTDTNSDKEMIDRTEATLTLDLSGMKPCATERREMRAASASRNSTSDDAEDLVSTPGPVQPGHRLSQGNRPSASVLRKSRACRVRAALTSIYGVKTRHRLAGESLEEIIRLGDSFLQVDIRTHLESLRHAWPAEGLWNRQPLSNPMCGQTRVEKLFNSVRCADILDRDSAVDPVRLRMARIILYHHHEQLCIDLPSNKQLRGQLSCGRDRASLAADVIVEALYNLGHEDQVDERMLRRYRSRLHKHKRIGKRWCMLASRLGLGVLFVCHRDIEIRM